LCRRKSKITNTSQSRAGLTEIIEDLDKLVSRVALAKPTTVVSIYLGNVVDIWEKFDQEKNSLLI
jgi:urocanate hydratase